MHQARKKVIIITDISFEEENYFYSQIVNKVTDFLVRKNVEIEKITVIYPVTETDSKKKASAKDTALIFKKIAKDIEKEVSTSLDAFIIVGEMGASLCKPLKRLFAKAQVYFVPLYSAENIETIVQAQGLGDFIRYLPRMISGVFNGLSYINRLEGAKIITFHPFETALYKSWGATSVTEILPYFERFTFGKEIPKTIGVLVDRRSIIKTGKLKETIDKISLRLEQELKEASFVFYATNEDIKRELEEIFPKSNIVILIDGVATSTIGLAFSSDKRLITFDFYFFVRNTIAFVAFAENMQLLFKDDNDSLIHSNQTLEVAYKLLRLLISDGDLRNARENIDIFDKKLFSVIAFEDKVGTVFYDLWNS